MTKKKPFNVPELKPAQFSFITPVTGMAMIPICYLGDTLYIKWTGGPGGPVTISLVNMCTWTVETVIVSNVANTGNYLWKVPYTLPCGLYECYIQNNSDAYDFHAYSNNFAITCPQFQWGEDGNIISHPCSPGK